VKWVLLLLVHLYWLAVPPSRRRPCLFKESCSRHVHRVASERGFIDAVAALRRRLRQCRPGYRFVASADPSRADLFLADGSVLCADAVSPELLRPLTESARTLETRLNGWHR
jgi:putative component of membrane protein insertase Oxa1/YidC/SpoIIIJ protein YidD